MPDSNLFKKRPEPDYSAPIDLNEERDPDEFWEPEKLTVAQPPHDFFGSGFDGARKGNENVRVPAPRIPPRKPYTNLR